jgi:uncharacterized protein YwgA
VFYRRKIILALLQLFNGQLDKIRLQKLLFLFTNKQTKADYDFVPYRYGCYLYSANADLTTMVTRGFLNEDEKSFKKKDKLDYLTHLKPTDRSLFWGLITYIFLKLVFNLINAVSCIFRAITIKFSRFNAKKILPSPPFSKEKY